MFTARNSSARAPRAKLIPTIHNYPHNSTEHTGTVPVQCLWYRTCAVPVQFTQAGVPVQFTQAGVPVQSFQLLLNLAITFTMNVAARAFFLHP